MRPAGRTLPTPGIGNPYVVKRSFMFCHGLLKREDGQTFHLTARKLDGNVCASVCLLFTLTRFYASITEQ